jgi:hypothetical protein
VESLGLTRRLPVACTTPMPLSMETLVTVPLTSQRSVEDCPRSMLVGSAVNCVTVGAAGGGGGGGGGGVATGAGAGGATFFLQPPAKTTSDNASPITVNFRLLNMDHLS